LLKHAKTLGPYAALKAEADAIESQRSLLAEPDPVRPLLDKVVDLLRLALNAKLEAYKPLPKPLRTQLEATVKAARDVAEKGARAAWPSWPWARPRRPTT
jgi:hypothetical protein